MPLHWRQFTTRLVCLAFVYQANARRSDRSRGNPRTILGNICSEDQSMQTGTIARLLIDKGFGFIRDEAGLEHFFHRSAVRGAVFELLREGQRVEFVVEESQKGPRAGDVRLIEG